MSNRRVVYDEEEFADAMNDDTVDEVEIHGDIKTKMVDIKAKGDVAWAVVVACFALCATALITAPATNGTSALIATPALAPAVSAVGLAIIGFLVKMVILTKSVTIVKQIYYNLKLEETCPEYIVMRKI